MDEDFSQLAMECSNCHLSFYATELRVDLATDLLKCTNCRAFPGGKVQLIRKEPPLQKKSTNAYLMVGEQKTTTVASASKDKFPNLAPGYTMFECSYCRYTFKRKSGYAANCPYCSKNSYKVLRRN